MIFSVETMFYNSLIRSVMTFRLENFPGLKICYTYDMFVAVLNNNDNYNINNKSPNVDALILIIESKEGSREKKKA